MRRVLVRTAAILLVVALLAVVGFGIGGWYYSDQLLAAPTPEPPTYEVPILAVADAPGSDDPATAGRTAARLDPGQNGDAGGITEPPAPGEGTEAAFVLGATEGDLVELGTVGMRTEDGLVVLEGGPETGPVTTTRAGRLIEGELPQVGELADASVATYAGTPAETLGLLCDVVDVPGDLGPLPAWRSVPPGADPDAPWVVFVHGRGAGKQQANRILATTYRLDLPNLVISVRNDVDAPASPDGYGRYGATEWEDLQAAVDHLQAAEGAERFILVGYSQGGSIVLSFLRRSPDAELADQAVLVSPLVSLEETLWLQAAERDIPAPLIPPLLLSTRWISFRRAGFDFSQVEHLERIEEIPDDVELLVTHGDADRTVPIEPSRELAEALPRQVRFEEYDGVAHVREWNADRDRFEAELRDFLISEQDRPAVTS